LSEITPEQWVEDNRRGLKNVDNHYFFFSLKEYGLRVINKKTLEVVKACWYLDKKGMWITASVVSHLIYQEPTISNFNTVRGKLHILGDKRVVLLKGKQGSTLCWTLHPDFRELLK